MAKTNICATCTHSQQNGYRITATQTGELIKRINYHCDIFNLPLFNMQPAADCPKRDIKPKELQTLSESL